MATLVPLTPAGSRVKAYLQGGPELQRALGNLVKGLRDDVLKEATLAGGEVFAEEWRERVPVLDGNYRDAINARSRAGKKGATAIVQPGKLPGLPDNEQPRAYAAKLEFGSSGRARSRSGRGSSYQGAQPSARPAFDAGRERAVAAVEAKLRQLIARAVP